MTHFGMLAGAVLAVLCAAGLVVVAHGQLRLAPGERFAILQAPALARLRFHFRLMSWISLVAVTGGALATLHAAARVDALSAQVTDANQALAELKAAALVAPAPAPAPAAAPAVAPVAATQAIPAPAAYAAPTPPAPASAPPPVPAAVATPVAVRATTGTFAVVRTGDKGKVMVRDAPGGQVLGSVIDGSPIVVIERDAAFAEGRAWSRVRIASSRVKGQIQGWVASEFIVETQSLASR